MLRGEDTGEEEEWGSRDGILAEVYGGDEEGREDY